MFCPHVLPRAPLISRYHHCDILWLDQIVKLVVISTIRIYTPHLKRSVLQQQRTVTDCNDKKLATAARFNACHSSSATVQVVMWSWMMGETCSRVSSAWRVLMQVVLSETLTAAQRSLWRWTDRQPLSKCTKKSSMMMMMIIIIIIIIMLALTFVQCTYNDIPETNRVPTVQCCSCSVFTVYGACMQCYFQC